MTAPDTGPFPFNDAFAGLLRATAEAWERGDWPTAAMLCGALNTLTVDLRYRMRARGSVADLIVLTEARALLVAGCGDGPPPARHSESPEYYMAQALRELKYEIARAQALQNNSTPEPQRGAP